MQTFTSDNYAIVKVVEDDYRLACISGKQEELIKWAHNDRIDVAHTKKDLIELRDLLDKLINEEYVNEKV